MKKLKNIVIIGGGTGTFTVLTGLKKYPVDLTAIVSMADSGGSAGRLRDELSVLPAGDLRQCLVALSQTSRLRDLFNYRFSSGSLSGHNFGNIFLAAMEKITGDFKQAVLEASKILNIKGAVVPVTSDKVDLYVKLENGKIICGEDKIDRVIGFDGNLRIKNAYLKPNGKITAEATSAILKADAIIIGPGDLYTSIIPNLLVTGVKEAIKKSRAKKIYVCNLMTKFGQTNSFRVFDHIKIIEKYLGHDILDVVLYNIEKPTSKILNYYKKEKEFFVEPDNKNFSKNIKWVGTNLLNTKIVQRVRGDVLHRSLIRHDSTKLAREILKLIR